MVAEFTGGWLAVAISGSVLSLVLLLIAATPYPLMLTAACAWLGARALRTGWPNFLAAVPLAGAGVWAAWLDGGTALDRMMLAETVRACANVALAVLFVIARPPHGTWTAPRRRWRLEDVSFLATTAAALPLLWLPPGGAWGALAVIVVVLSIGAALHLRTLRVVGALRALLLEGRVRAGRRRCARLPREMAVLFLSARRISDSLHRRTALQGLHIESSRLKLGRLQQQVEAKERDRRRAELEFERAKLAAEQAGRRWQSFADALPEALFITARDGRIEYASEGVRRLLGHDPAKLVRARVGDFVIVSSPATDPLELERLFAADQAPEPEERSLRFQDARGIPRELSVRMRVFQSGEGARIAIRLRESSGPLQRGRDQFVATMSHEIRTPLHGLMATLDMLRSESLSSEGSRRLGIARTSAKTLVRIANDVLDLTRVSAGGMPIERKPMSLQRLVDEVVDEARAREEALRLEVREMVSASVPAAVLGDPLRIKQVLRNLVSNALKFTSAGTVTVSAHAAGGNCTIDVADTGVGVPVHRRESIFEAFVQADRSSSRRHGGAGLGLAISRQLAEAMGGSLNLLQSGPGGSTFRLVLPLPATDEVPLDDQSQRNLAAVKGRILVAEDDEASRYVASALLESLECPARIVTNGVEALELLRSEEFDLALLDCEMPGLDGYEVTARIRKLGGRHIPIVAMTASAMSADRQRCFDAGMDDLLAKPFGKSALNEMLAKWLAPQPGQSAKAPLTKEVAGRPELDREVFEELRQSLNWQLPPLRKIYRSVSESAQKAIAALNGGAPADIELARRRLHSLQGGAGLVGARQLEYLAVRMLLALREQRRAELQEGLAMLVDLLRKFEAHIESRLDALSQR